MEVDWTESPDIEVVPGKVSGKPLLRETRIPADMLVAYYESLVGHGMNPDQAFADTDENYPGAGADRLRRVLDYARSHQPEPQR